MHGRTTNPRISTETGFTMDRETADEIKRHFNVVAEGLRSEIRTVAEGLQGFREEVSGEFRAVREEISEVDMTPYTLFKTP